MTSCSSLEAAISTPRLKISERGETIEQWLCIIQRIIFSYMCSVPESFSSSEENDGSGGSHSVLINQNGAQRLVKIYIKKLENDDARFIASTAKKKTVTARRLRSQYLRVKTEDLTDVLHDPLWMQKIICAKYPALGRLSKESKMQFKQDILNLTDLDIIYANMETVGGGRGRTPVGSFTESASQFFTTYLGESHQLDDQIMLKIWNTFAAIKATYGSLRTYQEKRGRKMSVDSNRFDTPLSILEQIQHLSKQIPVNSPQMEKTIAVVTRRSEFEAIFGLRSIVTDVEEIDDMSDMASGIEHLIKDVGISMIRLTEILSINKSHIIANIWKEFQIFCGPDEDYDNVIKTVLKCLKRYLEDDMAKMTEHVDELHKYLEEIGPTSSAQDCLNILRQTFNDPIKIFGVEADCAILARVKESLRDVLTRISENMLSLGCLNELSNILDSTMSTLENIMGLIEHRKGDKCKLVPFYIFSEKWKSFYNVMGSFDKKLMLNYAFEYNLHQAWMFIEQASYRKRA